MDGCQFVKDRCDVKKLKKRFIWSGKSGQRVDGEEEACSPHDQNGPLYFLFFFTLRMPIPSLFSFLSLCRFQQTNNTVLPLSRTRPEYLFLKHKL